MQVIDIKCLFSFKGTTLAEEEDDPLLVKHRASRNKASEAQAEQQSTDIATIKKLHVSVPNLQRVSIDIHDNFLYIHTVDVRTYC